MPGGMTTATTTTMTDALAADAEGEGSLIKLLTWLSPAFPTGAFAYSHALEWAVESGDITSEQTLLPWLEDVLAHGAGHTDAVLLRHAYRADDVEALGAVAELAEAAGPSRERRSETLGQGDAFGIAARVWGAPLLDALGRAVAYPVALGALARAHGAPEDAAALGLLHAFSANLVGAAVRLVPLGQTAGLRVLAALEPTIHRIAAATRTVPLDMIGGACFRSDIASMRHETQYTRLFRT
jgi:urease accessory protein